MLNFIAAASISSFFFGLFGVSWESVDDKIRREFPSVKSVSTDQLRSRYEEAGEILPLVIDVREVDEFGVSHLGDALNLETAQAIASMVAQRGLGKETEIVVYCSVGYRSAAVAADLQELGFTQSIQSRALLVRLGQQGLSDDRFQWQHRQGAPLQ